MSATIFPNVENRIPELVAGVSFLRGLNVWETTEPFDAWFTSEQQRATEHARAPEWESRRMAVRELLRTGGFKPSGRSKPAQEYLLRCVTEGEGLPRINPAVDCLNVFSLEIGLPISMLSLDRFSEQLVLRYGNSGESYVFNSANQSLDLSGLIAICGGIDGSVPLGTPVKDSMAGKITRETPDVAVVIYAPKSIFSQELLDTYALQLQSNISQWAIVP